MNEQTAQGRHEIIFVGLGPNSTYSMSNRKYSDGDTAIVDSATRNHLFSIGYAVDCTDENYDKINTLVSVAEAKRVELVEAAKQTGIVNPKSTPKNNKRNGTPVPEANGENAETESTE